MTVDAPKNVTQLLLAWSDGDQAALDQLVPLVYDELRRLARRYMASGVGQRSLYAAGRLEECPLAEPRTLLWRLGAVDASPVS